MPHLEVMLDADGMLDDIPLEKLIHVDAPIKVGALRHGMTSGKPSIGFGITLPDGRVVLAQTSLRLFHTAAKLFAARYGWQDAIPEGQDRLPS